MKMKLKEKYNWRKVRKQEIEIKQRWMRSNGSQGKYCTKWETKGRKW